MPADTEWDFPNAATPPGSPSYYVARFAPIGERDDLARLYAWRAELRHLVDKAGDPGVARLKLDWWRAELERAAAGEARHPLARALSRLAGGLAELRPFLEMLDAAELEVRNAQPATEDELVRQLDRAGGGFAELTLHAGSGGPFDPELRATARRLGVYAAAVRMLRDLPSTLQRDYCPLPSAVVAERQIAIDRLRESEPQRRLSDYARELLARLDVTPELQRPAIRRPELLTVRRQAALAHALRRKLERRDYPVLRQRIELSPIANLWIAWRLR